jgi:hypothetical protein
MLPVRLQTWPAIAALALCCLDAAAAPTTAPKAVSEQYLPDDAGIVVVLNVKQVVASPLYTRHFRKRLEGALGGDAVPPFVKDLAAALLRDSDRVTITMGRSGHDRPESSGPTIIVEGRLGEVEKAFHRATEADSPIVKARKTEGTAFYEVERRLDVPFRFAVFTNRSTLVLLPHEDQIAAVVEKAAGKQKTKLKSAALHDLLGRMKIDYGLQFAASESMVIWSTYSVRSDMGMKVSQVTVHTLGDDGIDTLQGNFLVGDEVRGNLKFTCKDEDTAKKHAEAATAGIDQAREQLKKAAEMEPQLKGVLAALGKVKMERTGATITFAGQGDAEALEGLVAGMLFRAAPKPPAVKPADAVRVPRKVDK